MGFLSYSLSLLVRVPTPESSTNIDEYVGIWETQQKDEPMLLDPSSLQRNVDFWFNFLMELPSLPLDGPVPLTFPRLNFLIHQKVAQFMGSMLWGNDIIKIPDEIEGGENVTIAIGGLCHRKFL